MSKSKYSYLGSLCDAVGAAEDDYLTASEKTKVRHLVNTYKANLSKNVERRRYYEDKNRVSFAGITLRDDINVRCEVGWCAKGVDYLALRSRIDGIYVNDEQDEALDAALDKCCFKDEYDRATPTELIHGYGIWTPSKGDVDAGDPPVVIRYHDGEDSAALWNYRKNRIDCAMVIEDYERTGDGSTLRPNLVHVYLDGSTIEFSREDKQSQWVSVRLANPMGVPAAVPMVYRPNIKPLGKSRISKAAMRITDDMQREIFLTNIQSRKHSLPTKYITNASDSLMDGMEKSAVYNDEMLVIGKDEDGETVTIGQLQAASPENHIALMDKHASEIASEFGLPVAAFGVSSNGYTSSDALRASTDDITQEAKNLNDRNGKAIAQLMLMVLAILRNKPLSDVVADGTSVSIHWADPAMPSEAQRADALVKHVSMMPWLAETDVILEQLGYDEPTRKRLMRQKGDAQAAQSLTAALMGAVGGTGQQAVETPQQAAQRAAE